MSKKVKCPICKKKVLAEIDEKGNVVYYDGDYWHGKFHKCGGKR